MASEAIAPNASRMNENSKLIINFLIITTPIQLQRVMVKNILIVIESVRLAGKLLWRSILFLLVLMGIG
ncbi:hypothetical protein LCGC14_2857320, partial [marine sediment metagenome]